MTKKTLIDLIKQDKKIISERISEDTSDVPESFMQALAELENGLTESCEL